MSGPIHLHLTNALGVNVSVALNSDADLLDAMRVWGRKRYRTISLPFGGLHFPLAMADTFDWSIIGAQPGERKNSKDKLVQGVWFENKFYTRREFAPNPNKDLEACVKYSRGANAEDRENPNVRVEEGTGDDAYVTLVIFRGTGKVTAEYERPRSQTPPPSRDPAPKAAAGPGLKGEALADAIARGEVQDPSAARSDGDDDILPELLRAIRHAAREQGMKNQELMDLSIRTIGTPDYDKTTNAKGRELFAAVAHAKGAA